MNIKYEYTYFKIYIVDVVRQLQFNLFNFFYILYLI